MEELCAADLLHKFVFALEVDINPAAVPTTLSRDKVPRLTGRIINHQSC